MTGNCIKKQIKFTFPQGTNAGPQDPKGCTDKTSVVPSLPVRSKASSTGAFLGKLHPLVIHEPPRVFLQPLTAQRNVLPQCPAHQIGIAPFRGEVGKKQSGIHHNFFICLCLGQQEASTERKKLLLMRSLQEILTMGNKIPAFWSGFGHPCCKESVHESTSVQVRTLHCRGRAPLLLSVPHSPSCWGLCRESISKRAASSQFTVTHCLPTHTCSGCTNLTAHIVHQAGPLFLPLQHQKSTQSMRKITKMMNWKV